VTWVYRQRREDWKDLSFKDVIEKDLIVFVEVTKIRKFDTGFCEIGHETSEKNLILSRGQLEDSLSNRRELFGWAQSVGRPSSNPSDDLVFKTGHPHLKELVEEARKNSDKFNPLKQRNQWVFCQIQKSCSKIQSGEFPIPKSLWSELFYQDWRVSPKA
jgi:hypothetical protein